MEKEKIKKEKQKKNSAILSVNAQEHAIFFLDSINLTLQKAYFVGLGEGVKPRLS